MQYRYGGFVSVLEAAPDAAANSKIIVVVVDIFDVPAYFQNLRCYGQIGIN